MTIVRFGLLVKFSTRKADAAAGNSPRKTGIQREYEINFHSDVMFDLSHETIFGQTNNGAPIERFNNVDVILLGIPQIETNTRVLRGTVVLKVNDSLWTFEIPAQNQKWDLITSQKMTNRNGQIVFRVHPIQIGDFIYPPRWTNQWYFGN